MMTSASLPSAAPRLPTAAAKNLLIPRAAARVRLAAGAAEHALTSVDAAPFPPLASTWLKKDLMDGFAAAAAGVALAPPLFAAALAAAASSWAAGTKTEVIKGCTAAATVEDALRFAAGDLARALEGRLREPCRSNTLAASCLVCACPLTLANSDLSGRHL